MKHSPAMAHTVHRRAPTHCALAWLLMLAVLFGQGLGAVHSISHGAPGADAHKHARADAPHAHGVARDHEHAFECEHRTGHGHADGHAHGHGQAPGLQALFDHAPHEPGCRLYDQLLQAGPLMPVSAVLAVPARTRTLPPRLTDVLLAAPAAVYQARGPPRA